MSFVGLGGTCPKCNTAIGPLFGVGVLTEKRQLQVIIFCVTCQKPNTFIFPIEQLEQICGAINKYNLDLVMGREIEEITASPEKKFDLGEPTEQDLRLLGAMKITWNPTPIPFTAP